MIFIVAARLLWTREVTILGEAGVFFAPAGRELNVPPPFFLSPSLSGAREVVSVLRIWLGFIVGMERVVAV